MLLFHSEHGFTAGIGKFPWSALKSSLSGNTPSAVRFRVDTSTAHVKYLQIRRSNNFCFFMRRERTAATALVLMPISGLFAQVFPLCKGMFTEMVSFRNILITWAESFLLYDRSLPFSRSVKYKVFPVLSKKMTNKKRK